MMISYEVNNDYWFLLGGRVEMMEDSMEAPRREIDEELGFIVQEKKLLWIVENSFTLENKYYHEIGFYFLVELNQKQKIESSEFIGKEVGYRNRWINIDELEEYKVLPEFLKSELSTAVMSTNEVKHLIIRG